MLKNLKGLVSLKGRSLINEVLQTKAYKLTVVANFFLDRRYVEIAADKSVRHIPWCVHDLTEGFLLETFEDFNVGCGSRTP
jgi:hypothetical protein